MTVSVHEPKVLVPVAIPLPDESTKFVALLKKARVVDMLAKAWLNTAPLVNVKD